MVAIEHDQPRARAEHGHAPARQLAQRLAQALTLKTQGDRGGLAPGDHQAVEGIEIGGHAHLARARAEAFEHALVRLEAALQGEHSDDEQVRAHGQTGRAPVTGRLPAALCQQLLALEL